MIRKFGLIGFPLEHSFSKKHFDAKFVRKRIKDAQYDLYPLKDIDDLPALLAQDEALLGLNVTVPYKQEVIKFCDTVDDVAKAVGAVNCLKISEGKIAGYNTDVVGFEKSLVPLLKSHHTHALILGSGGGSLAVQYVLKKLGISFKIVSRSDANNNLRYDTMNRDIFATRHLIINTTPLGMFPLVEKKPMIPYHLLTNRHLLFDLIYNPNQTQFLSDGKSRGAVIKNGLQMLKLQADESWRIWNEKG
jgi:shikimate dehydrogenase